jgi:hypothetical protein
MALILIKKETLPNELILQLLPNEDVFYFSYISYKGGCFSSSGRDEHWIALTNKRVLYKAKITEDKKTVEKEGVLPIEKISFIEVTDVKETSGCSSTQHYAIRISTSGGAVGIPVPTKEKGNEIRNTFQKVIEELNIK